MQPIHERMPVIIPPEHYHPWLAKTTSEDNAWALLENQTYSQMTATPVSDWVNSPLHQDARCIEAMPIRH
jgi:putative SOS response-associated peptidase YedK